MFQYTTALLAYRAPLWNTIMDDQKKKETNQGIYLQHLSIAYQVITNIRSTFLRADSESTNAGIRILKPDLES